MHRTKTLIGALSHKPALSILFCVTGYGLTGSGGPQRSLGVQMSWELRMARESGLINAIEELAGRNPGQWDKRTDTIVSRWQGADGIAIKSTFQVPGRKILEVRQGTIPLLYVDNKLDGRSEGQHWFLPGNWTQLIMAAVQTNQRAQPKNGTPQQEAGENPPASAQPKNYG